MSIRTITPERASELLQEGAALFDVREADEHARERIGLARNIPLAMIGRSSLPTGDVQAVVFHCKSGARTAANAAKLEAAACCDAYILEGGLDAWKRAGLPVLTDRKQPLEIIRQVQITAGALVLAGVVLGAIVQPLFYLLAGLIGAGLVFSGVSGTCAMASILRRMPWNRRWA
ncbi:MAG TPA: rhodanese family protein [Pseudolabrys sp.]|nr:rhodanese family protein [Pseudolabrys sp.]